MPDYTMEVLVDEAVDYAFDVEGIQPFINPQKGAVDFWDCPEDYESIDECTYLDPDYDEWHFTEVPVYNPPDAEQFSQEMSTRSEDNRNIRVRDSSGDIFVESGIREVSHVVKIADESIDEGLFRVLFSDVVDSLPTGTTYYDPGGLYDRILPEGVFNTITNGKYA